MAEVMANLAEMETLDSVVEQEDASVEEDVAVEEEQEEEEVEEEEEAAEEEEEAEVQEKFKIVSRKFCGSIQTFENESKRNLKSKILL